ncbi:MAG: hypothetical protein IT384_10305 [Deltaproteobacteria bacterium]|nr:hypothetical protein [Deltaproteobacteria bacterium]
MKLRAPDAQVLETPRPSQPPVLVPPPKKEVPAGPDAPRVLDLPKAPDFEALLELPPVARTEASRESYALPQGVLQGWWRTAVDFLHGSSATSELSRAKKSLELVNELGPEMRALTDEALQAKTGEFKQHVQVATQGERNALALAEAALEKAGDAERRTLAEAVEKARAKLYKVEQKVLDGILPEVFATVREASRRATGMFHYDVQVMGGALMHRGMIAEMYTGEGKTLAATLPAYLNALAGHGFHVATVNDYLARRDAEEMGAIYGYLGLTVGVLQGNFRQLVIPPGGKPEETTRQGAYQADITYGTASEFGFDYLRDNQVRDPADRVQRPLYGAILDEVDSLLIDEARIPLILASKGTAPDLERLTLHRNLAEKIYNDVLKALNGQKNKDPIFTPDDVEWEEHWISLTESGIEKAQQRLGVDDLYSEANLETLAYLQDALKAWFLFQESGSYAVVDGKISTVGLSGHLGPGRRFTGGLHQALEIKHHLEVLPENVSSAAITMREYLGLYAKRAGMTGTAMSARDLFSEVYHLDVARVPTREALIRVDYPDKRFLTEAEKTAQFLKDVEAVHATGRPIMIGVEYTHTAEWLGEELKKRGLEAQVLGAKSDTDEARIIANAGRIGAITVATTRGGRGVDIKLGGDKKVIAEELMTTKGLSQQDAVAEAAISAGKERAEVLALGGLLIASYEHLDSRRRDDQLRGRAGRQGEPGATIFYTSGEDRLFDTMKSEAEPTKKPFEFSLEKAPALTERALTLSEGRVNGSLSQSMPFDATIAGFRERFYLARKDVLESTNVRPLSEGLIDQAFDNTFEKVLGDDRKVPSLEKARELYGELAKILPLPKGEPPQQWAGSKVDAIRADLAKLVSALVAKREESVGGELARVLEKDAILRVADGGWTDYLEEVLEIRDSIHLRAFGQKDPKVEFLREAGELYGQVMAGISADAARAVLSPLPKLPGFAPSPPVEKDPKPAPEAPPKS